MAAGSDNRGFTLIEILVALTIFAIALLALAGMQFTAIRANSSANRLTQETAMAHGIMEQIRSWRPDDGRLSSDATDEDWVFKDGTTTRDGMTAVYSVAVDTPVGGVAQVTVDVTGAQSRTITLTEFKKTIF